MRLVKKNILFFWFLILLLFSPFLVSAQSYLVGKYIKIDGPFCWDYLGIARTEQAYELMDIALSRNDQNFFQAVLQNYDIIVVEKNVPVIVLDMKVIEGRARVTVLKGLQQGATGWIPLEWIENSYRKAKIWE